MSDREIVDKLEAVWGSIDELCSGFTKEQWKLPTDCPGWSVQDNLSHICGTESMLLGRPAPEHTPANTDHLRNEIGHANEVQVDYRRAWPGEKVLEEFRDITGQRLEQLRSWGPEDFDKDSWTPVGPGTVRDFLQIRIFDCWVHEQDMRRAVGKAGHMEGSVAEHAFERIASAMPYVVGKKAGVPNGKKVLFEVTGPAGGEVGIDVEGGRARRLDAVPGDVHVRLRMDLETFNALGCGRWDAEQAQQQGRVEIRGEEELGRRIISAMGFMI